MVSNRIIKIDLNKKTKNVVQMVQGDTNRKLTINVFDSDEPYLVNGVGGETIHGAVYIEKPDGTTCGYDTLEDDSPAVTGSGNTLTVYFVPQATTAHGWAYMTVSVFDDEGVELNTFGIDLFIDKKATATISADYWNLKSIEGLTAAMEGLSEQISDYRCVRIYNGTFNASTTNKQVGQQYIWPSGGLKDGDYVISKNLCIAVVSNCTVNTCKLTVVYRIETGGDTPTPTPIDHVTMDMIWSDVTEDFEDSGVAADSYIASLLADGYYTFSDGDSGDVFYVTIQNADGDKHTKVETFSGGVSSIEYYVNDVSCGAVLIDAVNHKIGPISLREPVNASDAATKNYVDTHSGEDVVVRVEGTAPILTVGGNSTYVCGECTSLSLTVDYMSQYAGKISSVIFISGATPTTLTINGATMPDDFEVEANTRYELTFRFSYGTAIGWPIVTS